jgi:hypothetical protein
MIRVVHPGSRSRIRILTFYPSRIQGLKGHRIPDLDPQRCRNELRTLFVAVSQTPEKTFSATQREERLREKNGRRGKEQCQSDRKKVWVVFTILVLTKQQDARILFTSNNVTKQCLT